MSGRHPRHDNGPFEGADDPPPSPGAREQETRGRGPKDINAYLLGDLLVVHLQGLLTPGEQQLEKIPSEKGRDLIKQIRTHLIEGAKPLLKAMAQEITGAQVVSLTGEAFIIFTLAESPSSRQARK